MKIHFHAVIYSRLRHLTKEVRPAKEQYQLVIATFQTFGMLMGFLVMKYGLVNESVMCSKKSNANFLVGFHGVDEHKSRQWFTD